MWDLRSFVFFKIKQKNPNYDKKIKNIMATEKRIQQVLDLWEDVECERGLNHNIEENLL